MKNMLDQYKGYAYVLFRIVIGAVFTMHGLAKFGVFGGDALTPAAGLFFWAGVFEVIIGPTIAIGLLTRPMAVLGAGEMVVALVVAHLPKGLNPLANGGEAALLFLVSFILIAMMGAGMLSLDQKVIPKLA